MHPCAETCCETTGQISVADECCFPAGPVIVDGSASRSGTGAVACADSCCGDDATPSMLVDSCDDGCCSPDKGDVKAVSDKCCSPAVAAPVACTDNCCNDDPTPVDSCKDGCCASDIVGLEAKRGDHSDAVAGDTCCSSLGETTPSGENGSGPQCSSSSSCNKGTSNGCFNVYTASYSSSYIQERARNHAHPGIRIAATSVLQLYSVASTKSLAVACSIM